MTYALLNRACLLVKEAHRIASYCVDNPHDAEDVAQNTLLNIYSNRQFEESAHNSKPYLARAVKNNACDFYRREARHKRLVNPHVIYNTVSGCAEVTIAEDTTVYVPLDQDEREVFETMADELEEAMLKLAPRKREAMELRAAGFSYVEIAEVQKVAIGTVRSRIHHGRRELNRLLKLDQ